MRLASTSRRQCDAPSADSAAHRTCAPFRENAMIIVPLHSLVGMSVASKLAKKEQSVFFFMHDVVRAEAVRMFLD